MSDTKQIAEWLRGHGYVAAMSSSRMRRAEGLSAFNVVDMSSLYESALRDKQRIAELEKALGCLMSDVHELVSESFGVAGLHLSGDVAPWEDLLPGGRFERLGSLEEAEAVIEKGEAP